MLDRAIALVIVVASASPVARVHASEPRAKAPAGEDSRDAGTPLDTEFELTIETVVPIAKYRGEARACADDPRFVVKGRVTWTGRADRLPLRSEQAFAVRDPVELGLNGWERGATICLILRTTGAGERAPCRLLATVPDAGCKGRRGG